MKRLLGKALTVLSAVVLYPLLTPACAENDQSIYIRNTLAPPTNRQNNVCVYQPDPTQPFLAEGLFDVAVRDSYVVYLLVGSQMNARGDTPNVRAESNRTHLNGAVVTVTDPGGAVLGEFTAPGTGFVDPQTNNTSSFGILSITAIDAQTAERIAATIPDNEPGRSKLVLANIKAFGKTLGGLDLESGEFQFPIRVCKGCLIVFEGADDPATPGVDCNLPLSTTGGVGGQQTVLPCNAGQDERTPCQLCSSLREACRTR